MNENTVKLKPFLLLATLEDADRREEPKVLDKIWAEGDQEARAFVQTRYDGREYSDCLLSAEEISTVPVLGIPEYGVIAADDDGKTVFFNREVEFEGLSGASAFTEEQSRAFCKIHPWATWMTIAQATQIDLRQQREEVESAPVRQFRTSMERLRA